MTTTNLNNFITKLSEIQTASNNNATTSTAMQTLYTNLTDIETLIDDDIINAAFPTTLDHLNKFVLVQQIRNDRIQILSSFVNFINIRDQKHLTDANLSQETTTPYVQDSYNFITFFKSLFCESDINHIIQKSKLC